MCQEREMVAAEIRKFTDVSESFTAMDIRDNIQKESGTRIKDCGTHVRRLFLLGCLPVSYVIQMVSNDGQTFCAYRHSEEVFDASSLIRTNEPDEDDVDDLAVERSVETDMEMRYDSIHND